ncbi:MAG: cyclically-permuted mutarotase family protein [Marinifilaceae bacterium]
MNKLFYILLVAICAACSTTNNNTTLVTSLPVLPTGNNDSVQGISAPFVGLLNNRLIAVGGCNFPGTPAAQGGKKIYYNDIYTLDVTDPVAWKHVGNFPQGVAYGATVVHNNKLICVGGNDDTMAFTTVWTIELIDGKIVVDTLPQMPVTMDNHSAAIHNNVLYAGGGNIDGKAQNRVFCLDLTNGQEWQEIPSFPGYGRIQPQLIGMDGMLVLLGGFYSSAQSGAVLSPQVLSYSIEQQTWDTLATLPLSVFDNKPLAMVGGFHVIESANSFIIGGGVNRTRFEQALNNDLLLNVAKLDGNQTVTDSILVEKKTYMLHQPAWYEFNTQLFRFDMNTKQWTQLANVPQLGRAGAGAALLNKNTLYIVDGELKPGIRTDEVNMLKWN